MDSIRDFRKFFKDNEVIIFDGAMGTLIYDSGYFFNKCYEELNLSNPDFIYEIHESYIKAGANVIETNTFGANRYKLRNFNLEDKIYDINEQGAKIARRAAGNDVFVAGSIGPLGTYIFTSSDEKRKEAFVYFQEQAKALQKGGVDLFILETFRDLQELKIAISAINDFSDLPIIASISFNEHGQTVFGTDIKTAILELNKENIDIIGTNCSVGPKPMLENLEEILKYAEKPVLAMPNAGFPQIVNDRLFYNTTPEYFAEYAKRFVELGVKCVGGCCGSNQRHIKEIRNALSIKINVHKIESLQIKEKEKVEKLVFEPIPLEKKSQLGEKLKEGKFVFSVEINPPKGSNISRILEMARFFKENGVDVVNIPDGPRASARVSPLAVAYMIQKEIGIEAISHYTCRDKSLIGMQSDLLGADVLGIRNLLIITGDPPKLGAYPDSTGVFDVDSIGLIKIVSNLNIGLDLAGNELKSQTSFLIAAGSNPAALNFDDEVNKTIEKIKNGAELLLTQPVFDVEQFLRFYEKISKYNIRFLVGLLPLLSYKQAEFIHNEIPGMSVPVEIRNKLSEAKSKEDAMEMGFDFTISILHKVKNLVNGAYIMMPSGNHKKALKIIKSIDE